MTENTTPSRSSLTDDEIRAECMRRDALDNHLVHYISSDTRTFRLIRVTMIWSMLDHGERYCMVKYGNIFDSEDECAAAISRALTR